MPLPLIVWGIGAAVTAFVGTAAVAGVAEAIKEENAESQSQSQSEEIERLQKEAEIKAENQRKAIKRADAKSYSREKLKSFINKYELSYHKQALDLDKLTNNIQTMSAVAIKQQMRNNFINSSSIRELDKKIQEETLILCSQDNAIKYLGELEHSYD